LYGLTDCIIELKFNTSVSYLASVVQSTGASYHYPLFTNISVCHPNSLAHTKTIEIVPTNPAYASFRTTYLLYSLNRRVLSLMLWPKVVEYIFAGNRVSVRLLTLS